jgi:hypothetical protein
MIGYQYRDIHPIGNSIVIDGGRDLPTNAHDGLVYENAVFDLLEYLAYRSRSRVGNIIVMGLVSYATGTANRGVRIFTSRRPIADAITTFLDTSSNPAARGSNPMFRRGHGAQAFITYYPFEWPTIGNGLPGQARDEILLHELIHAYMGQRGLSSPQQLRTGGFHNRVQEFDIFDDFFTVMITNAYASERGRPLRRDHNGFFPLHRSAEQIRSDRSFARFFNSLESALPELVHQLEQINTPFNPWRVRVAHP